MINNQIQRINVVGKQRNSRNCFICGLDNESGVKANFYNLEDGTVATIFRFRDIHQSYSGRVHGGIISAMLDELVGRALWVNSPDLYAVTTSMSIKFRKPMPYGESIKGRGYIIKNSSRIYTGYGELYDMDNNLLAELNGTYMKMSGKVASNSECDVEEEMCYLIEDEVKYFEFPEQKKEENIE